VTNLPDKSVDGMPLPTWDGSLDTVSHLLETRRVICAANWHARHRPDLLRALGSKHPFARRVAKRMKQESELIVVDEINEQGKFLVELKARREKELARAEASSNWDSSRRTAKHEKLWSNLAPLLEGV